MKTFSELKKNIKKDASHLKSIRIAILGDTATQFLAQALYGVGFDQGINLQIMEADFNQIELQVFDVNSQLYSFRPEIVLIFHSTHKLLNKYNKTTLEHQVRLADERLALIQDIYTEIQAKINAKVIYYNYPEINDSVFGNYANKVSSSFLFQIRKLNYELMLLSARSPNLFICDLSSIQNAVGRGNVFQASIYINADMVLSIDVLPQVALKSVDIINSVRGVFKKCLILDLDNTLWGGVIGDDGLENIQIGTLGIGKAFSEFQYWIKSLKNRGIILAVCSKNTESVAKEPFENHPDMVLSLDDIAVFIANWENKPDNIRKIQSILNISFDAMVFLDDNPFERNMVRENIPEITVPELPEDPADYLDYLYGLNLFETMSISHEDNERTKLYQVEAKRAEVQANFVNENDFLRSLDMVSVVEPFSKFNTPRVAQLSQRSNQFNLRTVRYTESDIARLAISQDYFSFTFTLKDKFGDNGMIAVIIARQETDNILFLESWFMSCRVLKRSMENFMLNTLVNFAQQNKMTFLKGEYIPTAKNAMVKEHYIRLGFQPLNNYFMLNVLDYKDRECFIKNSAF